jgi:hypothetical protein
MEHLPVTLIGGRGGRRVKPTIDTKFHVDYDWWVRQDRELRIYLISHLLPEQRAYFAEHYGTEETDWVDPETAEVRRVDALQHALRRASERSDFITPQTPLVDAVFRVFLANGNKPLTPVELGERIGRSPMTILRTFSGARVYKGIRPAIDD